MNVGWIRLVTEQWKMMVSWDMNRNIQAEIIYGCLWKINTGTDGATEIRHVLVSNQATNHPFGADSFWVIQATPCPCHDIVEQTMQQDVLLCPWELVVSIRSSGGVCSVQWPATLLCLKSFGELQPSHSLTRDHNQAAASNGVEGLANLLLMQFSKTQGTLEKFATSERQHATTSYQSCCGDNIISWLGGVVATTGDWKLGYPLVI